jgi:hypothetical protein
MTRCTDYERLPSCNLDATLSSVQKSCRNDRKRCQAHPMLRLNQRQRRIFLGLGMANLAVLIALGILLLQTPASPDSISLASPIDPRRLVSCRQSTTLALLDADQSGLVHVQDDGTIVIQLQRSINTGSLRFDADAATWTALEAVARGGDCLGFGAIQVSVIFTPSAQDAAIQGNQCQDQEQITANDTGRCQNLRAVARLSMADLMMWSLGEIDDAELAQRIDYQPPAVPQLQPTKPIDTP